MELLKSIFAQIGINKTFYVQFALVAVVYYFLSKFMFRPILTILVTRKHKVLGLKRMADEALTEAERANEGFSEKWKEYEIKGEAIKNETYERAAKDSKDRVKEANRKAHLVIEEKRQQMKTRLKDIDALLDKDVSAISESISDKLVGGGRK
jgi:F-type H+-transporting ATPase subunit b